MSKKSIMGAILAVSVLAWGFAPTLSLAENTGGDTTTLQQMQAQIQSLLAQIKALQDQIAQLKETRLELLKELREGSRGEDVRLLQEVLATDSEIYPEGLVTGYYGFLTKRAVGKFQKKFGIEGAGSVESKTMWKINELLTQGAGKSGKIPPGLLRAPGILKKLGSETAVPLLLSVSPTDNSTGVALDANLVMTFSKNMVPGSGDITIKKKSDNSVVEAIAATSTTGSGTKTITANPSRNLAIDTEYYVLVSAGALEDEAGNDYAGISDSTKWNFMTVDTVAPVVSSLSPADEATGVAVNSNLAMTFSEIVVVNTGNVTIKKDSDDSTVEEIAVGFLAGSGSSTITVNPSLDLAVNTKYYVLVGATAFKDAAGNMFAGISAKTVWNFTTVP